MLALPLSWEYTYIVCYIEVLHYFTEGNGTDDL